MRSTHSLLPVSPPDSRCKAAYPQIPGETSRSGSSRLPYLPSSSGAACWLTPRPPRPLPESHCCIPYTPIRSPLRSVCTFFLRPLQIPRLFLFCKMMIVSISQQYADGHYNIKKMCRKGLILSTFLKSGRYFTEIWHFIDLLQLWSIHPAGPARKRQEKCRWKRHWKRRCQGTLPNGAGPVPEAVSQMNSLMLY